MKLSDYIIKFLYENYNVDTVFTVSGGGCIHLIDSLGKSKDVKYIATHHEQGASIAAEGYARKKNNLGACIVTSGPGGTNALTGTLCSWLDSVPVIVISGQVNKQLTTNFTGLNLRQLGDQEFDIVKTAKTMTKYAVQVNNPNDIRFHLEKACYLATSGRPGPVWIDLPLDIQSSNIEPDLLMPFIPEKEEYEDIPASFIAEKLNNSKNPLLIVGNGIRLSGGIDSLFNFLNKTNIPVITAVNGNDIVNESYPNYYGRFGTHAQICANKIINESDFILSIGSRLYIRQIGHNFSDFGKNAYKVFVDIDQLELDKPTLMPDIKICSDAKIFLDKLNECSLNYCSPQWISYCNTFKTDKVLERHRNNSEYVSNYYFIEKLSKYLPSDYDLITSNGSANVVTMQVIELKDNQRLITNTGCAPMGYGLPCAIGVASTGQKVVCLEGDGSLHMNLHELQTLKHNNYPIKLILLNNQGYLSIKITQKSFFNSMYVASESNSGVSFPDYKKIADAYDLPYCQIKNNNEIDSVLQRFFSEDNLSFCEVFTDPDEVFEPKVVAKMDENGKFIPGSLSNIQWNDNKL